MWSSWWDFLHVGYTGVGTRGQVQKTANSFSNDSSGHLILMRAHTHTHMPLHSHTYWETHSATKTQLRLCSAFSMLLPLQKSEFSQGKKEGRKSVVHIIPTRMGERRKQVYDLVVFFKQIFSELRVSLQSCMSAASFYLTVSPMWLTGPKAPPN